ncbi:Structure-specific endonuclease subunit SLX4, partial [Gryllus bimaculatus]
KTKLKGTPLLLIRTQDERERLITEKVAIILTSEENKLTPPSDGNLEVFVKSSLQSEMLAQLQNQGCCLWEKASASPSPKDCDLYYVESLSYIISPSTIKAGSKLKHLSQVPCRLKTPKELQKYGLKPLKRKRAKQILRHIYNELHPLVPVHSKDGRSHPVSSPAGSEMPFSCTEKRAKKMSIPKKSKKNNKMDKDDAATVSSSEEAEISSENEVSFPSTQESSSSSQCQFEVLEDPAEDYALTQIDVSQLPGVVLNYIRKTPEFHQQVLLYEPIWLEQLQEGLKALSYKFKLTQLMEYLDEKCITFRTIHGSKTKQKQKKKKSK